MAHQEQRDYLMKVKKLFPTKFKGCEVLDVGSLNVNGTCRFMFDEPYKYTGIDVGKGPNVDIVALGHEYTRDEPFDIVISCECFEHDMYYEKTLVNIVNLIKGGGMFIFTCASTGRPEHGTRRAQANNAPLLEGEWADYYKNLTEEDIRKVLDIENIFSEFAFEYNDIAKDLYFWGIKR